MREKGVSDMALRSALTKPIIERRPRRGADPIGVARIQHGGTTLVDVLAPRSIDRRWTHMVQAGDSYLATLELRGLPPTLDLAWLSDPSLGLDAPGITIHQRLV